MRKVLNLARLNLLQVLRDRSELVSMLVLPVMLTFIFGLAFGGQSESEGTIAFTDDDGSAYSRQVRDILAEDGAFTLEATAAAAAGRMVSEGEAAAWVHVTEGFGEAVIAGRPARIEVRRDPSSTQSLAAAQIVRGAADRVAANVLAARLAVRALKDAREAFESKPLPAPPGASATATLPGGRGPALPAGGEGGAARRHGLGASLRPLAGVAVRDLPPEVRAELSATFPYLEEGPPFAEVYEAADGHWEPKPPVVVSSEEVKPSEVRGDSTHAEGFSQYSLGFTVMFVLFIALGSAGGILEERENGTLQRLLVTPASKRQILAGKILGVLVTASAEAAILILLGTYAFGVPWGRDPLALLMVMGAYVLAATGFAVLLSALVRTRGQFSALGNVSAVALAMLGGAYWPIDVVSPVMRRIADFTFTGWAMSGLVDVVARNQGAAAAVTPALVLLGFAAAFFLLGARLLRFE